LAGKTPRFDNDPGPLAAWQLSSWLINTAGKIFARAAQVKEARMTGKRRGCSTADRLQSIIGAE
jgi:hypothetical protein